MRLDELVWNELYPAIEERYQDSKGKFGGHYLNRKIKVICSQLCENKSSFHKSKKLGEQKFEQLSIFSELFAGI